MKRSEYERVKGSRKSRGRLKEEREQIKEKGITKLEESGKTFVDRGEMDYTT